jgi:hypothetical protein
MDLPRPITTTQNIFLEACKIIFVEIGVPVASAFRNYK